MFEFGLKEPTVSLEFVAKVRFESRRPKHHPKSAEPAGRHVRHTLGGLQHLLNRTNHALEDRPLSHQLFTPSRGQRVVPSFAIVVRRSPRRCGPAPDEESLKCGVEGALAYLQDFIGRGAEMLENSV